MTRRFRDSFRVQLLGILAVMALFMGAGFVTVRQVSIAVDDMIAHTTAARLRGTTASDVLSALQDSETGQLAFLLTGRPAFLAPFRAAADRIDGLLRTLETQVPEDPELRAAFARLSASAGAKAAELRRAADRAEAEGPAPAVRAMADGEGDRPMREAREAAGEIVRQAERERAARARVLQVTQGRITDLLLWSLVAAVLLLGAAALRLVWSRHRLRLARDGERREARQFRAAIEHVAPGVAVFDAQGVLRLANTRLAAALAVPSALATPGTELTPIAAAAAFEPPLSATPPTAPSFSEVRQGPRTLEVWRSPMPDGGQMLSVTDVTRRVEAEAVGRQAQKMDVLGQMTGGVAHDFNNLLQVVSANLELVRNRVERSVPPDAALLARIDAAAGGVARGARLTRHLLAFARRQPLAPQALDPARLLTGMEDVLRRTVREAVRLELRVGTGLWTMRADPVQVENALLNLAINARDAMTGPEPGSIAAGSLVVEVANAALDTDYAASVPELAPGQYVMFAVTDTGGGMTPEQLARATEPFFTTKGEGRGTGLGLSMVLGFAKQSGGHFQLFSERGRGTTARLYIPRTAAPAARPPDTGTQGVPGGNDRLVLLVEDDPGVRQAARDAVAGLGYRVVEAENGDAALRLMEDGLRPAILFTDVVMPGTLGARELAAASRALVPGLAVLFTSGYTHDGVDGGDRLDAGTTLLSKPWRTNQLARALHDVLGAEMPGAGAPRRVLLVEDEELVRATTADALAELGFDVVEAATAASALARLHPAPDLLLTDLGLPDGNGAELVKEVRRQLPALPVIVASGQSAPPEGERGSIVWLPKPYDHKGLREAVDLALAR